MSSLLYWVTGWLLVAIAAFIAMATLTQVELDQRHQHSTVAVIGGLCLLWPLVVFGLVLLYVIGSLFARGTSV